MINILHVYPPTNDPEFNNILIMGDREALKVLINAVQVALIHESNVCTFNTQDNAGNHYSITINLNDNMQDAAKVST